ncbi:MAG: hypothetical protein K6E22_06330, partial [Treponema sp.]|nr:hypothetical protein [Treponema sp.]
SDRKLPCFDCQHIDAPSMALFVYRYGPEPRKCHPLGMLGSRKIFGFKRQVPHYLNKKNLTYGYC